MKTLKMMQTPRRKNRKRKGKRRRKKMMLLDGTNPKQYVCFKTK